MALSKLSPHALVQDRHDEARRACSARVAVHRWCARSGVKPNWHYDMQYSIDSSLVVGCIQLSTALTKSALLKIV